MQEHLVLRVDGGLVVHMKTPMLYRISMTLESHREDFAMMENALGASFQELLVACGIFDIFFSNVSCRQDIGCLCVRRVSCFDWIP